MKERYKIIIGLVIISILLFFTLNDFTGIARMLNIRIIMFFIFIALILVITSKLGKKNYKSNIFSVNIPYYFEEMYQELYRNNNMEFLEELRKKARNRTVLQILGFFVTLIGAISANIIIIIIGFILILLGNNKTYEKQYKLIYKKDIINKFIKLVNDKLEYKVCDINSATIKRKYKIANFDNESFNMFETDDYISGVLEDDINIQMNDLHIRRKEVYYHEGKRREQIIEVFQGIFTQSDCNRDIGTYVKISKNQLKIFGQNNRVEMDSQEFEKYFDIYSENKILAMQLLTSDVMSTLVDFYNRYNLQYEIVIRNNIIYMRFFTGAMFEPKIFGNSMDKKLLFSYYCILKFIVDVTKEVNKALKEIEI